MTKETLERAERLLSEIGFIEKNVDALEKEKDFPDRGCWVSLEDHHGIYVPKEVKEIIIAPVREYFRKELDALEAEFAAL